MIRKTHLLLFAVTLPVLFITPVLAHAADASGNIQLTIPSNVQYRISSDGHLISPSSSVLSFENGSDFEVRIDAAKFSAREGFNVVEDASESSLPNSVSIKIGTPGGQIDLSKCSGTKRSVDDKLAWTMSTSDVSQAAASLPIATEGYGANIESVGTIGSIEWYVVSDTVTNQVISDISDLDERMTQVEGFGVVPIGTILDFGGASAPAGYLLCNGQAVSRADYPELFAAIGTTWGPGDGSSTFNVPDLRNRTAIGSSSTRAFSTTGGAETVTLTTAQIPSHTHTYTKPPTSTDSHTLTLNQIPSHNHDSGRALLNASGIGTNIKLTRGDLEVKWSQSGNSVNAGGGQGHSHGITNSTANSGSAGSDNAHENMPPYAAVNKIIRAS